MGVGMCGRVVWRVGGRGDCRLSSVIVVLRSLVSSVSALTVELVSLVCHTLLAGRRRHRFQAAGYDDEHCEDGARVQQDKCLPTPLP